MEREVEVGNGAVTLGEVRAHDGEGGGDVGDPFGRDGGDFGGVGRGVFEGAAAADLAVGEEAEGADGEGLDAVSGDVGEADDAGGSALVGDGVAERALGTLADEDVVRATSHVEASTGDGKTGTAGKGATTRGDAGDDGSISTVLLLLKGKKGNSSNKGAEKKITNHHHFILFVVVFLLMDVDF